MSLPDLSPEYLPEAVLDLSRIGSAQSCNNQRSGRLVDGPNLDANRKRMGMWGFHAISPQVTVDTRLIVHDFNIR
jgi:hypothetical protein